MLTDKELKRACQKIVEDLGYYGEITIEALKGEWRNIIISVVTANEIHARGTLTLAVWDKMNKAFPMHSFTKASCRREPIDAESKRAIITINYRGERII